MRTKTLLLTAALSAAGVASSMAQVYSVNAVGYVNLTLRGNGRANLVANTFNKGGNTLGEVIDPSTVPDGTSVTLWNSLAPGFGANGANSQSADFGGGSFAWSDPSLPIPPGTGFYIQFLAGTPDPITLTFIGEVAQGSPVPGAPTVYGDAGGGSGKFSLVSSQVPQGGKIKTDLKFETAQLGDSLQQFDASLLTVGNFKAESFVYDDVGNPGDPQWYGTGGLPKEPELYVGESVYILRTSATSSSWSRNFSVNP